MNLLIVEAGIERLTLFTTAVHCAAAEDHLDDDHAWFTAGSVTFCCGLKFNDLKKKLY